MWACQPEMVRARWPAVANSLILFAWAIGSLVSNPVWAEGDPQATTVGREVKRAYAVLVDEEPTIDGILDDAVWGRARVIDDLVQVEPRTGERPTFRTEIRILTDAKTLFVSVRAYDPAPEKIVANRMARSESFFYDDGFNVNLDTFHDRRSGYFFQVNPNGGRRDGTFDGDAFEENWDGIWYAKARIDDQGWTAEMAIPFKTLGFKEGQDVWGLNLSRRVRRFNEEDRWADATLERLSINMSRAGTLHGMSVARQGVGLDVVPALSIGSTHSQYQREFRRPGEDSIAERDRLHVEPSFDAFYRLLPSLTASVTANTDFAQTEVDDTKVNLTRFSLFFPEKREFFLRDTGLFTFGGLTSENGLPFFSRKIGLDQNFQGTRLLGGGKLTGRVGPFRIGLLDIQQDEKGDVDSTNLAVARISANVLEESTIGVIATHGDPTSNGENLLAGADFNFRSSQIVPGRFVTSSLWYQQSFFTENESANYGRNANSWGASLEYPNDEVNWSLKVKSIDQGFDPALGFVNRDEIRRYDGSYRYRIRSATNRVRTFDMKVSAEVTTDLDNRMETTQISVEPFRITSQVDDAIGLRLVQIIDEVPAAFYIAPHVGIPEGRYSYTSGIIEMSTSQHRKLRFNLSTGVGGFYDGWGYRINPFIEWRPSKHWVFSIEIDERHFQGFDACRGSTRGTGACVPNAGQPVQRSTDFETRLIRFRTLIAFTPDIFWSTVVQYDNLSNDLSLQSRFRWIIEPGREFFLVVGQGFDATPGTFRSVYTEPVAKLRWTFRF